MYQPHEQAPLGAAYYGPPIPAQSYQRPNRRCSCCLLSSLIKFIIGFIVTIGIIILIFWLVFRPLKIEVAVENASLTKFNLTASPNNTLSFSLATNISMRNPNSRIGIYYDWLEADAYYDGARFSWVPLPTFYQGHKSTTVVSPSFQGSALFVNGDAGDFQRDKGNGFFDIDVWLFARVRYKFGSWITSGYVTRVKCGLGLKLVSNSTADNGFTRTWCDIVESLLK